MITDWLLWILLFFYFVAAGSLMIYGLNTYVLIFLFKRRIKETRTRQKETRDNFLHKTKDLGDEGWPLVTTQLPLYNELNVTERVIRAVSRMDYPVQRHQIQVVDDSNDETVDLVNEVVTELQAQGINIVICRRGDRHGYKAGALKQAMETATGEFIAIFDSDFVPESDFLKRMVPLFRHEKTGLVQARWSHLNTNHSALTRAQSMGIDGHFVIEQVARAENGLFFNFNGTAGVWRKAAIVDAGGWQADTLTEDLDLSYRCQLQGWQLDYAIDVTVPAELPETYTAFKSQQFRWAKGSVQTAKKLLVQVLQSPTSIMVKIQAMFHLLHYIAHLMMFLIAVLYLPLVIMIPRFSGLGGSLILIGPLIIATLGPSILYLISQHYIDPKNWKRRILWLPEMVTIGFGTCLSNSRGVVEALLGVESGFVRTPKKGQVLKKDYKTKFDWVPFAEIFAAIYCLITMIIFLYQGVFGGLVFFLFYGFGFLKSGITSILEQRSTE
ncbi:MAG: glycosyltransferase [Akkermansiaceae bacterium]